MNSRRAAQIIAVTATARKIAVLFYNALRRGMDYVDPGASYYETRYRARVIENLQRRAKAFGFELQAAAAPVAEPAVSGVIVESVPKRTLRIVHELCRGFWDAREFLDGIPGWKFV